METSFSSLWSRFLGFEQSAVGKTGDSNEQSAALIAENEVVRFARFEYKTLRTKIPALQKTERGLVLYYPFLSAYPKESEILHIAIDVQILERLGYKVDQIYSVYLNKD